MQSVMEPITPGPLPLITHISRELGASGQIMPLLSTRAVISVVFLSTDAVRIKIYIYFHFLTCADHLPSPQTIALRFGFSSLKSCSILPSMVTLTVISLWTDAVDKHFESIFNHFLRDRCRCRTIFRLLFNMFSSESDGV